MDHRKFWGRPQIMAVALILAVGMVGLGMASASQKIFSSAIHASLKLADPNEGPSKTGFAPVVKGVLPDVVNISTSKMVKTSAQSLGDMPDFFQQFFGQQFGGQDGPDSDNPSPRQRGQGQQRQQQGRQGEQREDSLGSGVIVSPEGYILTNNHVIEGA